MSATGQLETMILPRCMSAIAFRPPEVDGRLTAPPERPLRAHTGRRGKVHLDPKADIEVPAKKVSVAPGPDFPASHSEGRDSTLFCRPSVRHNQIDAWATVPNPPR